MNQEREKWEKEFDEKFDHIIPKIMIEGKSALKEEMIPFIRHAIQTAREEGYTQGFDDNEKKPFEEVYQQGRADLKREMMEKMPKEIKKKFNAEFGYKDGYEFHDDYDAKEHGWNGASMVKNAGCDDCGKCQNDRENHRDFIINEIKHSLEEL